MGKNFNYILICVNIFFIKITELYTPYAPDGLPYVFFKKSSNIFKFKVKAKLSAHIALATTPDASKPYIEFVIEHFGNEDDHRSFLRTRASGTFVNRVTVPTYGFLNENEYRGFWISFADGVRKIAFFYS